MGKIFNRTPLLIILVWALVLFAIVQSTTSSQQLVENAATLQMESDLQIWDIVHELSDDSIARAVIDYAYWDDMVAFAEGKLDTAWALENLSPALPPRRIDAVWVLDSNGNHQYSAMAEGEALVSPPPFPLDLTALKKLLASPDEEYGSVREFSWFSPSGPMTIFGSGITTSDDPDHTKPARGYYFVGVRLSNDGSLNALSSIGAVAEAQQLDNVPDQEAPTATSPHVFYHPMLDNSGKPIGAIRIERATAAFKILASTSVRGRYLTAGLWMVIGLAATALIIALNRTTQRAAAMADEMTGQLRESNARLEDRVAERTADLEVDIAKREEVEETLLKRTDELERMNKVMMDRELRIVELKKNAGNKSGGEPPPQS
jgi:hypothetical protein